MKKFVYIVTDRNRSCLHVGLCADLLKTLKFYRDMPNLFFDASQQLNRLVYFEELEEEQAAQRFAMMSHYTRMQKEKTIRGANPDWVDLTLGLDFEKVITQRAPIHNVRYAPVFS
ncbi:MAG: GIY-YIG nuclease family protein [Mucilaginibacter polytrichastri]|nr:GIY-YIG nuclease family protein [Mucilaginibacter polytrichastri]